jgi:hypothetical protein
MALGGPVHIANPADDPVRVGIYDESGERVGVTNNNLDVLAGDQTTEPIDSYFAQSVDGSNFTLSADTVASGITAASLVYSFEATAGHSITANDEILLLDTATNKSFYAIVLSVSVNTVTLDRPIDNVYSASTTLGREVITNMAVDGSVTPQIFSIRAGAVERDHTRFIINILDDSSMDDGQFGGLGAALTRGFVFRIVNSFQKTIFNFKTNGEIASFCYDTKYADRAPGGQFGLTARITFAGQSKHGVALRIGENDVLQWVVQDNLTGLISLKVVAQGHVTEGVQ